MPPPSDLLRYKPSPEVAFYPFILKNILRYWRQPPLEDLKDNDECCICLEYYALGPNPELPAQLPCGHIMGQGCLLKWVNLRQPDSDHWQFACPYCRQNFVWFKGQPEPGKARPEQRSGGSRRVFFIYDALFCLLLLMIGYGFVGLCAKYPVLIGCKYDVSGVLTCVGFVQWIREYQLAVWRWTHMVYIVRQAVIQGNCHYSEKDGLHSIICGSRTPGVST